MQALVQLPVAPGTALGCWGCAAGWEGYKAHGGLQERDVQSVKKAALGRFPACGLELGGCSSSRSCRPCGGGLAAHPPQALPAPPSLGSPQRWDPHSLHCWKPWTGRVWEDQLRVTVGREVGEWSLRLWSKSKKPRQEPTHCIVEEEEEQVPCPWQGLEQPDPCRPFHPNHSVVL